MKFVLDNLYLILIAAASGGMLLWPLVRRSGHASVSPAQATQLINQRNAIVVDVRGEQAFAAGSVTGARNLPLASIAERAQDLVRFKARPAVIVCDTGQQSPRAAEALKAQGFEEIHTLAGGLAAWKQAGLPLVQSQRDGPRGDARPTSKGRGRHEQGRDRGRGGDRSRGNGKGKPMAEAAPPVAARGAANDDVDGRSVDEAPVALPASGATDRVKEIS